MIKVSVVVPVYNAQKDLENCLKSILNQSYQNIELILVNDGSKDESINICRKYQNKDSRVLVIDRENKGVSCTRNDGIDVSSGEYIMFVDADDEISVDTIKDNLQLLIKYDADISIFCFRYNIIDANRIEYNEVESDFVGNSESFFRNNFDILLDRELVNPPWNKLIRKEVLDKNHIRFNTKYSICEDMAFSIQAISAAQKLVLNHKTYYDYRIKSSGSLVFQYHNNYFEALTFFYHETINYCDNFKNNNKQKKKLDDLFIKLSITFIKKTIKNDELSKSKKIDIIKRITHDIHFKKALENATLDRNKRVIRKLIHWNFYEGIYRIYRILKW